MRTSTALRRCHPPTCPSKDGGGVRSPCLVRSGHLDDVIDRGTVIVDLLSPRVWWYVDHHLTNRPDEDAAAAFEAAGGRLDWAAEPSAARVAHNLVAPFSDLQHLAKLMPFVDAIDSGGIEREVFLADGPLVRLARCLGTSQAEFMHHVLACWWRVRTRRPLSRTPKWPRVWRQPLKTGKPRSRPSTHGPPWSIVWPFAGWRVATTCQRVLVTAHVGRMQMRAASSTVTWTAPWNATIGRPCRRASTRIPSTKAAGGWTCLDWPRCSMKRGRSANACGCRIQAIDATGAAEDRPVEAEDVERTGSVAALWATLPELA